MQDKVGEKDLVLIEKNQNEKSIGKDQNFFNVILNEELKEGELVPCVYIESEFLEAKKQVKKIATFRLNEINKK